MQISKRSNSNPLKRYTSQTSLPSHLPYGANQPSSPLSNAMINHIKSMHPPMSIVFNKSNKDGFVPSLKKISSVMQLKNRQITLAMTEEKIFGEVLKLIDEINELKSNLVGVKIELQEFSVMYPQIEQKVVYHSYRTPLSQSECVRIQQENNKLQKRIRDMEEGKSKSLEEVLRIEKQKYQQLKRELNFSDELNDTNNVEQKKKIIREQIRKLEQTRTTKVRKYFPQFIQLKQQNQSLRQKTIKTLIEDRKTQQQQNQLLQYLKSDEYNREQFMKQLSQWKKQFKRIKLQNQQLSQKILSKRKNEQKQNYDINLQNSSKNSKVLGLQSQFKKNNRLEEYEAIITRIKSLKK